MIWIDLTISPKKAFIKGFWKGVSAPLMLFSSSHDTLPVQAQPRGFQPLQRHVSDPMQDWVNVGQTLMSAAQAEHEKIRG